jgi:CHASE3 domain sensor protein
MKKIIEKNIITIASAVIVLLVIINAALTVFNKGEVERNNLLRQESDIVKQTTKMILTHIMHGFDMGIRAYALTQKEDILMPLNDAIRLKDGIFNTLDSLLTKQKYDVSSLNHFRETIEEYTAFNLQMVEAVRSGNMDQFRVMQAEDRGYPVWLEYEKLSNDIMAFEESLNQRALADYNAALSNNLLLQIILLLVSVPAIGAILFKIKKDEDKRRELLNSLDANNKKYLFNPGKVSEDEDASHVIETSISNFKKASEFIKQIAKGNFEVQWEGLTPENYALNEETLAGELVRMRENMKKVKIEDEKRMWTTEGLAKFSEIVRNHQTDIEKLGIETIRFLVRYLNVQQGSLFIVNDQDKDDIHLSLVSCYAFDKRKYLEKRIEIGDGLVGQAYLEKEIIMLKEVPNGYTTITSGLGEATPNCIVIVPMKYNENIEGILELAGFDTFTEHQLAFLEKAGEFVASALMTVKISEKTQLLLKQSQEQAEMLKSQEEELRQNMEELEATQEEMARKTKLLMEEHNIII